MNFAVILSGGIGTRMGMGDFPKQFIKVKDRSILEYTLDAFESAPEVDAIIIVIAPKWWETLGDALCAKYTKIVGTALPGEIRQESIMNGLTACMERSASDSDKVIIHDAVRPLVSCALIGECLGQIPQYDGCLPVIPATDTIYYSEDGKSIGKLLDRSVLYMGQSPEAFVLHKYYEANQNRTRAFLEQMHGTAEIAFAAGLEVRIIRGETLNFKITDPADLQRFESIVESRCQKESGQTYETQKKENR